MARLCLQLLGGFRARLEPGIAVSLPTRKAEALIGYLALPLGQPHPRDKLASLLWGDLSDSRARASLRQALFRVRRAVDASDRRCLRLEGDGIALDPSSVAVDVAAFEDAVAMAAPDGLARAIALYQGDLLAGLALAEPPFEEWLLTERERLRELAVEALARLLAHHRAEGRPEEAVQTALRLAALDPLQEAVHRTLMRLYAQLGRRGAALRQYEHCVAILRRELGIEPETETKQLYQHLLRARPVARAEGPVAPGPAGSPDGDASLPSGLPATDTPLIARTREVAGLRARLEGARSGRGGVVAVEGEAGIGKSRLLAEVVAEASRAGMRVLVGRCYESEQSLPFGPFIDALRSGGLTRDAQALRGIEPTCRAELARLFPELGGPAIPTSSADARRLFESMTRLLEEGAAVTPLVLVLEDVHWADDMSLRLLAFVGRRIAARPVLVAVSGRAEELADRPPARRILDELQGERRLDRIPLSPLAREDTLTLMHILLGPARVSTDRSRLGAQVWALSQGNPFVVMEALRAVVEREGADLLPLTVPDRVRAVISRRLDHLGARSQELVAAAAVIGREFTFALLHHAAGQGEHEAAAAVEELVRRQVLQHVGNHFDFLHDRVREVVYDGLLPPRRILLHRAVADAIEALSGESPQAPSLALGLHCLHGEAWDRAVTHLGRAGARAIERSAYREAAGCLEQAVAALAHMPADRPRLIQAVDLRLDLARPTLYQLGHVKRAVAVLLEAEEIARALGDPARLGRVTAHLTFCFRSLGQKVEAIEAGQRALAIATRLGDLEIEIPANTGLGQILHDRGDYRAAVALFRRTVDLLVGDLALRAFRGGAPRAIHARACLVSSLAELGEFGEAAERGEEAMRVARAIAHPHALVMASAGIGHMLIRRGEGALAIDVLEPAVAIARAEDVALWFPRTASTLGAAYLLAGRPAEARRLLGEALERTMAREVMHQRPLIMVWLGEAALADDLLGEAEAIADQALGLARNNDERGHEAWALRLLGDIGAQRGPAERSAALYRAALALADAREMKPLVARCLLGLGELGRPVGAGDPRAAPLEIAAAMLRAMAMGPWLARASARLEPRRLH
jgi:DNA-binding SARP family transcriptional activator